MKKPVIIAIVTAVFLVVLWFVGQATHMLEFYTVSTTSNLPTYQPGQTIVASKLAKPDRNKFIVFKTKDNKTWIFRCIGKGGDIVEIKHTELFVNNKKMDEPYANNEYFILKKDLDKIAGFVAKNKNEVKRMNDTVSVITLTYPQLKESGLNLTVCSQPFDQVNHKMPAEFKQWHYNEDNFGQVIVPKGTYFVLGDNRHDAYDSRYLGYIKEEDVISTVIK